MASKMSYRVCSEESLQSKGVGQPAAQRNKPPPCPWKLGTAEQHAFSFLLKRNGERKSPRCCATCKRRADICRACKQAWKKDPASGEDKRNTTLCPPCRLQESPGKVSFLKKKKYNETYKKKVQKRRDEEFSAALSEDEQDDEQDDEIEKEEESFRHSGDSSSPFAPPWEDVDNREEEVENNEEEQGDEFTKVEAFSFQEHGVDWAVDIVYEEDQAPSRLEGSRSLGAYTNASFLFNYL